MNYSRLGLEYRVGIKKQRYVEPKQKGLKKLDILLYAAFVVSVLITIWGAFR